MQSMQSGGDPMDDTILETKCIGCRVDWLTIAFSLDRIRPDIKESWLKVAQALQGREKGSVTLPSDDGLTAECYRASGDVVRFNNGEISKGEISFAENAPWALEIAFRALYIARVGLEGAIARARQIAEAFCLHSASPSATGDPIVRSAILGERVRRVDLAADFTGFPIHDSDAECFVGSMMRARGVGSLSQFLPEETEDVGDEFIADRRVYHRKLKVTFCDRLSAPFAIVDFFRSNAGPRCDAESSADWCLLRSSLRSAPMRKDEAFASKSVPMLVTGYTLCAGRPLMCRIYNKIAQIEATSDPEKRVARIEAESARWKANGWNGDDPVTRVEFQLRSEVIKEFGVRAPGVLAESLDAIWKYLTCFDVVVCNADGEPIRCRDGSGLTVVRDSDGTALVEMLRTRKKGWIRLVIPGTASRPSRCKVDPRWQAVRAVRFKSDPEPAIRTRIRGGATVASVLGCARSNLAKDDRLPRFRDDTRFDDEATARQFCIDTLKATVDAVVWHQVERWDADVARYKSFDPDTNPKRLPRSWNWFGIASSMLREHNAVHDRFATGPPVLGIVPRCLSDPNRDAYDEAERASLEVPMVVEMALVKFTPCVDCRDEGAICKACGAWIRDEENAGCVFDPSSLHAH